MYEGKTVFSSEDVIKIYTPGSLKSEASDASASEDDEVRIYVTGEVDSFCGRI